MKLNNKGWGTNQMIFMILFLLIMLGVAWYYINTLYNGVLAENTVSVKEEYYETVKYSLKKAAQKYYEDNNLSGQRVLSYKLLKNQGYISNLQDFLDASCTGYVTVNNDVYKPYIKCNGYTSNGYVEDFE